MRKSIFTYTLLQLLPASLRFQFYYSLSSLRVSVPDVSVLITMESSCTNNRTSDYAVFREQSERKWYARESVSAKITFHVVKVLNAKPNFDEIKLSVTICHERGKIYISVNVNVAASWVQMENLSLMSMYLYSYK